MKLVHRLVIGSIIALFATGPCVATTIHRDLQSIDVNAAPIPPKNEITHAAVTSDVAYDKSQGGGMVTLSTYEDNGLWELIKKTFYKILDIKSDLLVGVGPRSHSGAGSLLVSENKERGTITIKVYDNYQLFQRIEKLTERIAKRAPSHLRQTTSE